MEFNIRRFLLRCSSLVSVLILAFVTPQITSAADNDDPPGRVARLSYASGAVSFNPAGTDDWSSAVVNRPLTIGDKLWTDNGARAELNLGTAAIRLGDQTGFSFLNLDDRATQIQMIEGTLNVRVRRLDQDEVFEIDTPNLAFSILRPGTYRINVNESGDATMVAVRTGEGEVTGGGSAYTVRAGESGMFSGVDQLSADMQGYPGADDFDRWSNERDRRWDRSSAPRYVSDDVIGYEDLDDYGGWRPVPEYGNVWFPRTTAAGWAPYRDGHWVWISPWGWTWVDDEPWGFAPFHYGRWVVVDGSWGWVPSPPRPGVVTAGYVRPVYSPALVAWVGGSHFGVGVGVGSTPVGVAWFPLGPRDVYCPSYHVSERYVERVNVSNTTIVNRTQVTNVYNTVYVNKTVNVTNVRYQNQGGPNAVTAVSHQAFVAGQPVNRNIVRVDSKEVASAPVAPLTPSVAPQARSAVGAAAPARVRPSAQAMARPVMAKTIPPPAPPAFTSQQQAIQSNGGRPIARSQERQLQAANRPAARPNVRMAPPARPASNQPANRTSQPNQPAQPSNKPAQPPAQPERPSAAPPVQPSNRPPNQPNQPVQPNNRPGRPQAERPNAAPPAQPNDRPPNQPNAPANPPANPRREDRPPSARPANPPAVNPQSEQKNQQQADRTRQQQEQERQRLEQKQQQEQQQEQQQMQQRKQQQQEQTQRKPDQQQQKPEQKQKPEAKKQQPQQQQPQQQQPPKENRPPKSDKDKDKPPPQ
jgi:DNA segregation ATPase FtsK/SpoIIIE-like protein